MSSFKDRFDQFFDSWKRNYLRVSRRLIWLFVAIAAAIALIAAVIVYFPNRELDFGLVVPTLNWFLFSMLFLVITDFVFGMPMLARDFMKETKGESLTRYNSVVLRNELLHKFISIGRYKWIWIVIALLLIGLMFLTHEGFVFSFLIILFYSWLFMLSSGLLAASFFRYPLPSILVLLLWLLPGLILISMILIDLDWGPDVLFNLRLKIFLVQHQRSGLDAGSLAYFYDITHPEKSYNPIWLSMALVSINILSLISISAACTIMNIRFPGRKKVLIDYSG
jgi:hypothetical protein